MTKLMSVMLFGAVLLLSSVASAETSYVCSFRRQMSSTYGNAGATIVSYMSGPHCTGTLFGTRYYCSPGTTSSNCTNSSSYQFGGAELNALFSAFHTAAIEGAKVFHTDGSCNGGGTSCAGFVLFYGS